jgi:hypothetical protein
LLQLFNLFFICDNESVLVLAASDLELNVEFVLLNCDGYQLINNPLTKIITYIERPFCEQSTKSP